jgi:hypothetical protein
MYQILLKPVLHVIDVERSLYFPVPSMNRLNDGRSLGDTFVLFLLFYFCIVCQTFKDPVTHFYYGFI